VHFRVTSLRDGYQSWQSPEVTLVYEQIDSDGIDSDGADSSGALWTPAEITTALWLDAADAGTLWADTAATTHATGLTARWDDKSGNGRNATQATSGNRPTTGSVTVNSLNALDFDGSNDRFGLSSYIPANASGSALTAFAVANSTANSNRAILNTRPTSATQGWVLRTTTTTNLQYFHTGATPNPERTISTGVNLLGFVRNGLDVTLADNGSLSSAVTTSGFTASTQALIIGAESGGGFNYFDGPICEIILVESVLTTGERQIIEGYLAWKWGLEANLPSGHPYEFGPPTV